ncbi:MarR family winged helix-turn-helix transcriptional regulator [Paenibacillus aestuarii]|uniref:MarR family winged helix-turn-helix transcriptional regulator n=1 Tax=Paenibacillus aestuarii TaxID=516965 RepID=A0ABW0KD98_9BACL|nr:MarR family transcriptional regulator [Paenibacillus aestuarii]
MDQQAFESIQLELAILIRRIMSVSSHKKIGNIERSAYLLLHHIRDQGSVGVKALAETLQLDISTVSRQAGALEQKGYVFKVPDPQDGRAYSFKLTDFGMAELLEFKQARSNMLKELLQEWSDEDCANFSRLLNKFNESLCEK